MIKSWLSLISKGAGGKLDLHLNTCILDGKNGLIQKHISPDDLRNLGFDCVVINSSSKALFEYISKNKVDILVANTDGLDKDRFSYVLDIVYNNFCKNILIVSDTEWVSYDSINYMDDKDMMNFDLKFNMMLLRIKKQIEMSPSRNVALIKSKVCEILCEFMFSSKHDGFVYYVDAICKAFFKFPFNYSTMEIYKEVAEKYGKTVCAVEKSMRKALVYAQEKLASLPTTQENTKLKKYLTYNLTNNTAISMIVSRLVLDKDINSSLDNAVGTVDYQ